MNVYCPLFGLMINCYLVTFVHVSFWEQCSDKYSNLLCILYVQLNRHRLYHLFMFQTEPSGTANWQLLENKEQLSEKTKRALSPAEPGRARLRSSQAEEDAEVGEKRGSWRRIWPQGFTEPCAAPLNDRRSALRQLWPYKDTNRLQETNKVNQTKRWMSCKA